MRILAVDNRAQTLEETAALVGELQPEAELLCSGSSLEALGVARKTDMPFSYNRFSRVSSHSKLYSPSAGSSAAQAKIPTLIRLQPASCIRRMSS